MAEMDSSKKPSFRKLLNTANKVRMRLPNSLLPQEDAGHVAEEQPSSGCDEGEEMSVASEEVSVYGIDINTFARSQIDPDKTDVFDKLRQSAEELKSTLSESLPKPEQAQAVADFIDQRIRQLGSTLRSEIQQTSEQLHCEIQKTSQKLRDEMEQMHQQQQEALRRQAIYQWLISGALIVAVFARLVLKNQNLF